MRFQYVIAGKGPERSRLETVIERLGLTKEVSFGGAVSEEEKSELYKESDFFLLPSVFDEEDGSIEGYGIVFIEAYAYGLPVLSGNTGGMVEAVVDGVTGYHCDGSIEDIADKIKKITEAPFDVSAIQSHAQKHDLRRQECFISFLNERGPSVPH